MKDTKKDLDLDLNLKSQKKMQISLIKQTNLTSKQSKRPRQEDTAESQSYLNDSIQMGDYASVNASLNAQVNLKADLSKFPQREPNRQSAFPMLRRKRQFPNSVTGSLN